MSGNAVETSHYQLGGLASLLNGEETSDRKKAVSKPAFFIRNILGYQLRPFHARWLDFQNTNVETLILAPRGHGKSTVCTVAYSLWKLLADVNTRILVVSNTAEQAGSLAGEIKLQTQTNEPLRQLLGEPRSGAWRANMFTLARRTRICKEASVTSTGVEGAIVSRHYELIILDDVVDEENSYTRRARDKLRTWYAKVLLPCLEPGGELHILGTRYHPRDLYGALMEPVSEGDDQNAY